MPDHAAKIAAALDEACCLWPDAMLTTVKRDGERATVEEAAEIIREHIGPLVEALNKITKVKLSWNGCLNCKEIARAALEQIEVNHD